MQNPAPDIPLNHTPLDTLHRELGAKIVSFAGYAMPVQYPAGVMKEHLHTRRAAGLFDVSHMGQVLLHGDADAALEALTPADISALPRDRMRYTQFTTETGGIIDDLMVTRRAPAMLQLVVNAGGKAEDLNHLSAHLTSGVEIEYLADQALLALQGPQAAAVLARYVPGIDRMPFMTGMSAPLLGAPAYITRSGYTGEDGYEISIPNENAEPVARTLLSQAEVMPIGLGARDSLRLEACMCLYGHDIDQSTTPVEANLAWSIGKRRREQGGFKGAETIRRQLADPPARLRVALLPADRTPARDGTPILDAGGAVVGTVTSGGFSPSLDRPVAMGYVPTHLAFPGTELTLSVRGKPLAAKVVRMPFVPTRYFRG